MATKDEGSALPPQSKSSWGSFLKAIASFNGDLSTLTAPPFILSTTSLTEYSAYWTEHPSLFVAPASERDPAKRALLVLKWFLSTLKQQYSSRSEKLGSEKKPLNPFLGELFLGKWVDDSGETQLVSEQVSHHPPVTAYCIWNEKHGVKLEGYNGQKASFSRTIHVRQVGHALLTLTPTSTNAIKSPETYLITLPSLHIEGLIYGSPFVELNKATYIASSTGYVAKIDYSGKGWLSGKKNSFTASLYKEGEEKHPQYTVDGQWSEGFSVKESKKEVESYDAKVAKITPLTVAPLDDQDIYESRKAWSQVAKSIEKGDMDAVSHHKSRIEHAQRELRKKEQAEGREWERRFFTKIDDKHDKPENEKLFEKLAKMIGVIGPYGAPGIEADKTGGVWRFDSEKAREAKPPFHDEDGLGVGGLSRSTTEDSSAPLSKTTTENSHHSGKTS